MKKILSILLTVLVIFSSFSMLTVSASQNYYYGDDDYNSDEDYDDNYDTSETNVKYDFNKETGTLTFTGTGAIDYGKDYRPYRNYLSDIKNVVINDGITEIGDFTFWNCDNIKSITIPDSVTAIGKEALENCDSLSNIKIPNSVNTIGDYAFNGCGLTEITIPSSVTTIGDGVFEYSDLKKVTIEDGVTKIGEYAFQECSELESVKLPDDIRYFGRGFFRNCYRLTNIDLPKKLENIGYCAFDRCYSLKNIVIPKNVEYIASEAFINCINLKTVSFLGSGMKIEEAFYGCVNLEKVNFADDSHGYDFGDKAFMNCEKLTSFTIPDGVNELGSYVFANCHKLSNITMPNSVTSIGENILNGTEYYYNESNWSDGMLYIDNCLLYIDNPMKKIKIKKGTVAISSDAFRNNDTVEEIDLSELVNCFPNGAFTGCTNLKTITIPLFHIKADDSIEATDFDKCDNLTDIYFTGSKNQWKKMRFDKSGITVHYGIKADNTKVYSGEITDTSSWSFNNKTKTLTITGKGEIPGYNFKNISEEIQPWDLYSPSVKSVVIKDGITSIGENAFKNHKNLTSISIPKSVTRIHEGAFLNTAHYNNKKNWKDGILYIGNYLIKCDGSKEYYVVKNGTKYMAERAFENCEKLKSVLLPDSLLEVSNCAFLNCKNLKNVTIPKNVKTIEDCAFYGCTSLTDIVIPKSVTDIGSYVLDESKSLKHIYYTGSQANWKSMEIYQANYQLFNTKIFYNYNATKKPLPQQIITISLNKKSLTLKKGKTTTLKTTIAPSYATNKNIKWTTSNSKIATVSSKGKVTAKKKGTCYIIATAKDGSKKSAKCKIVVK